MYVRILDVAHALESRTYATDGHLRFTVDDPFMPDLGGSFALDVTDGNVSCRRIDGADIDVDLSTVELANLYLGGGDALAMSRAGLVRGDADSITMLGRMFRGDVAPWCEEVF